MTITATDIQFPGTGAINNAEGSLWMRYLSLAFTGTYPVSGGEPFDPVANWPGAAPSQVITVTVDGGAGYDFEFQKGAKTLKIYSAAGTELAGGTYPAALSGDTNTVAKVTAK